MGILAILFIPSNLSRHDAGSTGSPQAESAGKKGTEGNKGGSFLMTPMVGRFLRKRRQTTPPASSGGAQAGSAAATRQGVDDTALAPDLGWRMGLHGQVTLNGATNMKQQMPTQKKRSGESMAY